MQVNINHEKSIDGFAERIISMDLEEYNEIVLCLKCWLETLEEKIEEYKNAEDKRLREFVPKREKEILRLKELIKLMQ